MSNIFGNMDTSGVEESRDVLGGFSVFESDAYDGIIKLAYAGKSQNSNAQSVTVHVDLDGREYRETIWITNKDGQPYYLDKNDSTKKLPLPGFVTIDDFCLLSTGLPLQEQTTEEKVVPLYDFEAKKELPKNVHVITSILGLPITIGVLKRVVDKTKKNDSTGQYEPTGETREENVIDKVFHTETKKTTVELREGKESIFYEKWIDKNKGKTRELAKGAAGQSGRPNAGATKPVNGAGAGRSTGSLFNKG